MERFHVAIIMDGNGRWALKRGLPRVAGHRAGAAAVRRVVEAAPDLGIETLTLYAFSEDNWSRPPREVTALMRLLGHYLVEETGRCMKNGVRLQAIGRRDRLPAPLVALLENAEAQRRRAAGACICGWRWTIPRAGPCWKRRGGWEASVREENIFRRRLGPDVDLLIRTSGEQRLSDFLLWECAYAEMVFTPRMWPTFTGEDLADAVDDFRAATAVSAVIAPLCPEEDDRPSHGREEGRAPGPSPHPAPLDTLEA